MIDSSFEDVPVHGSKNINLKIGKHPTHHRNHSLDFRHVTPDGPRLGCGHQRNRSLDSVLQRIPEDITPTTSPEDAIVRFQSPSGVCPFQTNAGSDDSGIHALPDGFEKDEEPPPPPVAARSRESLDSGNPEDADKLNSDDGEKPPDPPDSFCNKGETLTLPNTLPVYKGKDSLLRLFENKHFDMKMAITYLCKSNEPGVQSYLANKLFSYPPEEVDFYLPQLAIMFIEMGDMGEMLKPYLEKRCEQSAEFSLRLVWLLAAFGGNAKRASATEFRMSIIAEKIRPAPRRGHHRSQSDASALRLTTPTGKYLGDLASGRAFDNGCMCGDTCSCGAPRLAPQIQFLSALTNICRRLTGVTYKEGRNGILRAELAALDLNLPAKVWLPLHHKQHYVLRIPPHAAAVLNSSEKAPYIMYVEVLETEGHEPLPPRLLPPAPHSPPMRQSKSEENLAPEWPTAFYNPNEGIDTECWSYDDDEVAYFHSKPPTPDTVSQMSAFSALSLSSTGSRESVTAAEVRRKLTSATELSPNVFRHDPHDPSAMALKESWQDKHHRLRSSSPYGSLPGWCLLGCIVKVGDDLRQELLAVQLLRRLQAAWAEERLLLTLTPYEIICLDESCGFIQPILNTVSLHQIKKQSGATLRDWLHLEHGPDNSESFLQAQMNFIRSTAAYALVSYLLQLKDRHNGNILLDNEGHIIHIDFGFILSQTPKNLGFERSPFKLTQEFVDVMDGEDSDNFQYFKQLILQGLIAAKKHCEHVVNLVELMKMGGHLPCLRSSRAVSSFRSRFHLNKTDAELQKIVDRLVKDSMNSYSTRLYDKFQYYTNGIL